MIPTQCSHTTRQPTGFFPLLSSFSKKIPCHFRARLSPHLWDVARALMVKYFLFSDL
jgi:hypothetical protein